jgi:hypothetical protein
MVVTAMPYLPLLPLLPQASDFFLVCSAGQATLRYLFAGNAQPRDFPNRKDISCCTSHEVRSPSPRIDCPVLDGAQHVNHRSAVAERPTWSDNPCRAVNQFLVWGRRRGENGLRGTLRARRSARQAGQAAQTRDAEVPKTRPVAELRQKRGVNERAGTFAGKRIGSP